MFLIKYQFVLYALLVTFCINICSHFVLNCHVYNGTACTVACILRYFKWVFIVRPFRAVWTFILRPYFMTVMPMSYGCITAQTAVCRAECWLIQICMIQICLWCACSHSDAAARTRKWFHAVTEEAGWGTPWGLASEGGTLSHRL